MIINKIMKVIEENNVHCSAQHGSRRHRSMATANLIFKNALESAWENKTRIYGSSWDISKAFDSVSKDMIRLAWERVGVSTQIVDWLIALDADNHTIVRTEWAMESWEEAEYEAFARDGAEGRVPYFTPEIGTGQGDTSSPATWVVFFDIVLRALEMEDSDPF